MPEAAVMPEPIVRPSIALELDFALGTLNGHHPIASLPPELAEAVAPALADWGAVWEGVLGEPGRQLDVLELAAGLAGVLLEDDYSQVTLAARELSPAAALANLSGRAGTHAGPPSADRPTTTTETPQEGGSPAQRLTAAVAHRQSSLFKELGFPPAAVAQQAQHVERQMADVVRILAGGDLHARFWHWLDRYYYRHYGPWRETRGRVLAQARERASNALANRAQDGLPGMAWLPAQSPLLRMPELRAAYAERRLQLALWIEPFGLADSFALYCPPGHLGPPMLVMSCAEAGPIYTHFRAAAGDVAARAAALADPTRLIILRMIRHFGMVNTEIAEYLGLSRPTVSIHAKVLRDAGLISSRQEGRLVRHEINPDEVRRLFHDLERFLDLPEERGPDGG